MSENNDLMLECILCACIEESNNFQEIFDEVGTELQLDKLLEKHFNVKIQPEAEKRQVLCEVCVNSIIELVDINEYEENKQRQIKQQLEEEEKNEVKLDAAEVEASTKLGNRKRAGRKTTASGAKVKVPSKSAIKAETRTDCYQIVENDGEVNIKILTVAQENSTTAQDDTTNVGVVLDLLDEEHLILEPKTATEETISIHEQEEIEILDDNFDDEQVFEDICNEVLSAYDVDDDEQSVTRNVEAAEFKKEHFAMSEDNCVIELAKSEAGENVSDVRNSLKELDNIDINHYLDEVINSKLEDLQFDWIVACEHCSLHFEKYQHLLEHIKSKHKYKNKFTCTIENCKEKLTGIKLLARHIILRHADLESLQICGECPDCNYRFNNFLLFNKHSCFRQVKRYPGMHLFCVRCQLDFQSFKRYIFHVQFHREKRRPKVCLICNELFSDINKLFTHIYYGHETTTATTLVCKICDLTFLKKQFYVAHRKSHITKLKYACNVCPKRYGHKHLLTRHLEVSHNSPLIEFLCDYCNLLFRKETTWEKHMNTHTPEVEAQVCVCIKCGLIAQDNAELIKHTKNRTSNCYKATIESDTISLAYNCEFCSMDFKSSTDLKLHRTQAHADNLYSCASCSLTFDELKAVRNHIKTHEPYNALLQTLPLKRFYLCNIGECEQSYSHWSSLDYHKKRSHKVYNCWNCKKKYNKVEAYEAHVKSCVEKDDKNEFICQTCGKICKSKMSLGVHMSKSHNNKHVNCPHCKTAHKNEVDLKKHIEHLHIPKTCTMCNKTIKSERYLQKHIRIVHMDEQRFFCDVCKKGYFYKSELEVHQKNTHTDIIYKCKECNFQTNYSKSYDIHMAKHNNQYQFKCPHCSKQFVRKQVFNIHLKRHNTSEQIRCSEHIENGCNSTFISNNLLNVHIRRQHKNAVYKSTPTATASPPPPTKRAKLKATKQQRGKKSTKQEKILPTAESIKSNVIDADDPDNVEMVNDFTEWMIEEEDVEDMST